MATVVYVRPLIKVFQDLATLKKSGVIKQLCQNDFLTLDTEFLMNKTENQLSLIQISTRDKNVFLFDVLKCQDMIEELREVFESDKITKVIHDCVNDSKVLWNTSCIKMKNVFDVKLVQQILDSQDKKVILKRVKPCGLEAMCINHGIEFDSDLKQSTKDKMKENEAYFLQRKPDGSIPQEIKEYAVQDVTVLVDLYNKMKRYPGESMEPLYKRLIKVSLYAHLRGVDCRSMYERDKALMNHIATPDLAEHDVSPNSRRRLNGRGNKRKPRKR